MMDLGVPEPSTDEAVDGDISMDGSQSCELRYVWRMGMMTDNTLAINLDDDLPPLERARRRKMLAGTA